MDLQHHGLLQAASGLFLADGGGERDALRGMGGRASLREHLLGLLELARALDAGFILDAPIYQSRGLQLESAEAEAIDRWAIAFAQELRQVADLTRPVMVQATLSAWSEPQELQAREQLRRLARSGVELIAGPAFHGAEPAIGFIETVGAAGLPVAVALAIDRDGRLADGRGLREAIETVDAATGSAAAWFTVTCSGPADLLNALAVAGGWTRRIRGLRILPAEPGAIDPAALRRAYSALAERAPSIAIADLAGGCGLRHAAAMAAAWRERTLVEA